MMHKKLNERETKIHLELMGFSSKFCSSLCEFSNVGDIVNNFLLGIICKKTSVCREKEQYKD